MRLRGRRHLGSRDVRPGDPGIARKFIVWEHTVLPWRIRHELSVTACAIALRILRRRLDRIVSVESGQRSSGTATDGQRVPTLVIPNPADGDVERSVSSPVPRPERSSSHSIAVLGDRLADPAQELATGHPSPGAASATLRTATGRRRPGPGPVVTAGSRLGVGGRVTFLGHVESVETLLDQADIVVHPSYRQTFGYVLMEAAATTSQWRSSTCRS